MPRDPKSLERSLRQFIYIEVADVGFQYPRALLRFSADSSDHRVGDVHLFLVILCMQRGLNYLLNCLEPSSVREHIMLDLCLNRIAERWIENRTEEEDLG